MLHPTARRTSTTPDDGPSGGDRRHRFSGDVTATHELWRLNDIGRPASHRPLIADGEELFVVDNSANLYADRRRRRERSCGRAQRRHVSAKARPCGRTARSTSPRSTAASHILSMRDGEGMRTLNSTSRSSCDVGRRYGRRSTAHRRWPPTGVIYFTTDAGLYARGRSEGEVRARQGDGRARPRVKPVKIAPYAIHVVRGPVDSRRRRASPSNSTFERWTPPAFRVDDASTSSCRRLGSRQAELAVQGHRTARSHGDTLTAGSQAGHRICRRPPSTT